MQMSYVREIELSGITLLVEQGEEAEEGGVVWDSALVTVHYMARHPDIWKNRVVGFVRFACRQILEVGCGTGVGGLAASAMGASLVILTDLPSIIPRVSRNVALNGNILGGKVHVECLDWRDERSPPEADILVAVDCVYYEETVLPLVMLMRHFPRSFVAIERRDIGQPRIAQDMFFQLLPKHFNVEVVPEKEMDEQFSSPDIRVFWLTPKNE